MSKGRCQDYTNIEVWTDLFLWLEQPEFSDQPFSYQSDALHLQVVLFHVNQMKCIFKLFLKKKKTWQQYYNSSTSQNVCQLTKENEDATAKLSGPSITQMFMGRSLGTSVAKFSAQCEARRLC